VKLATEYTMFVGSIASLDRFDQQIFVINNKIIISKAPVYITT